MADTAKLKLSWQHPTIRQDGAPLKLSEIRQSNVYWNCDGKKGSLAVAAPANAMLVGLPASEICTYNVSATDTAGSEGELSAPYTYSDKALPNPPEWGYGEPLPDEGKLKLQWINPNIREDGSLLPPTEINYTTVYWTCNGKTGSTTAQGTQDWFKVGLPPSGACSYRLTTTDLYGLVSADSLTYTYYESKEQPNPPEWISKTITEDGYLKLEWKHPTERIDGTSLPAEEIELTSVGWTCNVIAPHNVLIESPQNYYLAELPEQGDKCVYVLQTKDTFATFSQNSEPYIYDATQPKPEPDFPIDKVDTTYFDAWILVLGFVHVITLILIFLLALRVYRKFYDDLPKKEPDEVTETEDVKNE